MSESYKIGEIANILNIKSYVLRFWESEFPQINPERTAKGQRLYSAQDLETIKKIQDLLHNHGMTISGAKRVLEQGDSFLENKQIDELPKLVHQNDEAKKLELLKHEAQNLDIKNLDVQKNEENRLVQASLIDAQSIAKENAKKTVLLSEIVQELQAISDLLGQKE